MKIHIVTVGTPKLAYAKQGWEEYWKRLKHYHSIRVTHLSDKHNDSAHLFQKMTGAYSVALVIDGPQLTSQELAGFLDKRAMAGQELCLLIGGPDGLPDDVKQQADMTLSFSRLTFPHDLAMVVLLEALYRASTLNAGQPYHR